eukprot:4781987-Pleurochrysis_carterae.AAC.1
MSPPGLSSAPPADPGVGRVGRASLGSAVRALARARPLVRAAGCGSRRSPGKGSSASRASSSGM